MTNKAVPLRATFKERLVILDIMKPHISKIEDSALWQYEAGWSDDVVLSAMNAKLKEENTRQLGVLSIVFVRTECFGKLYEAKGNNADVRVIKLEDAFKKLASDHQELLGMLATAERRITTLELAYKHKGHN